MLVQIRVFYPTWQVGQEREGTAGLDLSAVNTSNDDCRG